MRLIIGVSGASGFRYAVDLLWRLRDTVPGQSDLIFSPAAMEVAKLEAGFSAATPEECLTEIFKHPPGNLTRSTDANPLHTFNVYPNDRLQAPCASGSNHYDGMIVIPASMKTVATLASGMASGLMERAADVTLKERRRLVVVPRETPYNRIHLQNMLSLTEAGAIVLPASPGFYHNPQSIDELCAFISARVLSLFGIKLPTALEWNPDE